MKLRKVPEITLFFWLTKVIVTTLGETAGDMVSMYFSVGYLVASLIFLAPLFVLIYVQIQSNQLSYMIYWGAILATTCLGTTLADFIDRSLGLGYPLGVLIVCMLLITSFIFWRVTQGEVKINYFYNKSSQIMYWITILVSQTLGTALGDWTSDSLDFGYFGGIEIFSVVLIVLVLMHYRTTLSSIFIFWVAFIFSRPFGAVVGDYLDKPISAGGLGLNIVAATTLLIVIFLGLVFIQKRQAMRGLSSQ